jgi:dihydroneopterin aldolase
MTGKVVLEGLEFHAYHGVYPHERSSGNKFEVDVVIDTEFSDSAFRDELTGTINYEDVYAIVKDVMDRPAKLLEISKFNPPIGGVCKKASVVVNKERA